MSLPVEVSVAGLIDEFDALLFDLDGVVYIGPEAVPHAAGVIAAAHTRGVACAYVTNNAARPAREVADHLVSLGIPATVGEVITSPQAAVSLLPTYVGPGAKVLVIGGDGITQALVDEGYVPVRRLDDVPAAVMQGYSPDLTWRDLAEATFAVRSGLPWIATNLDLTIPTARGIAPGNGSLVQVVARAVGRDPDAVAGKPEPPLLTEAIGRLSSRHPVMIGDRLDTDIAAGSRIGIPTLLVFTGVTSFEDLVSAIPEERPYYLGADLRVLLEPYPAVRVEGRTATCREATARLTGAVIELDGMGNEPWDGLRAVAALAWRCADVGADADAHAALDVLAGLRP